MDAIFDSGLAGLTVSIDGYRAETFARLREGGEVEKVFAALDEVVRRKTALGHHRFDYPQIQINYTLMKSNLDELIPLIEHSRRWELENFTVVHVYSAGRKDMSHEFLVDSPEESDRILRQARQKCEEYDISPRFPQLFRPDPPAAQPTDAEKAAVSPCSAGPDLSCAAPWQMLKIRWNGSIYPCDLWDAANHFGSLQTQSFEEIWMSDKYKELRTGLHSGRPTLANCIGCDRISQDNLEGRKIESPLAHTPVSKLKSLLSKLVGT
jgi:radical SAM protein with 4Fe4S-binding SPASM domain